jgi:hypothetical protein
MTTHTNDMHTRAMLVTLNISSWTARKYDKKVSKEVADSHNADLSAGRYNKHLLPTTADITKQQLKAAGKKAKVVESPNSYKDLMQHIGEIRAWHYENTLPWADDGKRVLTIANYYPYMDGMRKKQHQFDTLLDAFVRDYPVLKAEAQRILNGMFNSADYPETVRERFDFAFRIDPVPAGGDWRVELSDEEIKVLAASTEARAREAFENAQADAVKRLYEVVANIHNRLSTEEQCDKCKGKGETIETRKRPKKGQKVTCWICGGSGKNGATFRDTLIENAKSVVDVLKRINLADDPKLEEYRAWTEQLAMSNDPATLRDNQDARAKTAQEAQAILAKMVGTYGKSMFQQ